MVICIRSAMILWQVQTPSMDERPSTCWVWDHFGALGLVARLNPHPYHSLLPVH